MSNTVSRRGFMYAAPAAAVLVGLAACDNAQAPSAPAPAPEAAATPAPVTVGHKVVVLYPAQPDPEAFKKYYVETHIPLVRKMPGLIALRYSFDVRSRDPNGSPYAAVFEADFKDAEALGAAMGSPEGQAVGADVANFTKVAPTVINYVVTGT